MFAKYIGVNTEVNQSKRSIMLAVAETFQVHWHNNLNSETLDPILRTYTSMNFEIHMEPHSKNTITS